MTSADQDRERGRILPFRRPPVRQSVMVRVSQQRAFDVFANKIGDWWPVRQFSAGRDRVCAVTIDAVRSLVYETWDDGSTIPWGELLVWDPPRRFVITWNSTPVVTEVELGFAQLSSTLTRVSVEHRGWEALSDAQLAEDCAMPGGYQGGAYSTGWRTILGQFAATVGSAGP